MAFGVPAEMYDGLVDWPKRLGREGGFYRGVFERYGVKSVLDAACGTGRHAGMFHSWGLEVEGADVSAEMIARARELVGVKEGLRFVVRGFEEPAGRGFDAVVCAGNSLGLVGNAGRVRDAVAAMMGAVNDGGVLVLHVLNLWAMADGKTVWQRGVRMGENVVVKGVRRARDRGYVEVVVAGLNGGIAGAETAEFLGIDGEEVAAIVRSTGGKTIEVYGGYGGERYERGTSVDLVMVAGK